MTSTGLEKRCSKSISHNKMRKLAIEDQTSGLGLGMTDSEGGMQVVISKGGKSPRGHPAEGSTTAYTKEQLEIFSFERVREKRISLRRGNTGGTD